MCGLLIRYTHHPATTVQNYQTDDWYNLWIRYYRKLRTVLVHATRTMTVAVKYTIFFALMEANCFTLSFRIDTVIGG